MAARKGKKRAESSSEDSSSPSASRSVSGSGSASNSSGDAERIFLHAASDIHLEFDGTDTKCEDLTLFRAATASMGDGTRVLALLGDIGNWNSDRDDDPETADADLEIYRKFLYQQAKLFAHVFVISGNHEYYGAQREQVDDEIRKVCKKCPTKNCHFLQRDAFDVGSIRFLGCTLWSHLPIKESGMNDHVLIMKKGKNKKLKAVTIKDTNTWHAQDRAWLEEAIADARRDDSVKKIVVLTHHAPTHRLTFLPNEECLKFAYYFGTDLEDQMEGVHAWLFGHTHRSGVEYVEHDDGTRTTMAANQLGYCMGVDGEGPQKGTRFEPDWFLEIRA